MNLKEIQNELTKYQLMTRVNSLVETSTGRRLATFSLEELLYVDENISKTEYSDLKEFIKKLLEGTPLLRTGSEDKEEVSESDFIFY